MDKKPQEISSQQSDQAIRFLRLARIGVIIFLALMAPLLLFFKIITQDSVIWVSILFAFIAVSDWFVIGHVIKRMEQAKEQMY